MIDELDMGNLGEEKVALFALIPDNHTAYNFLVSILYTQLFQELFYNHFLLLLIKFVSKYG